MANKNDNIPLYTDEPKGPRLGRVPMWAISGGLVAVVASWVPLVVSMRARVSEAQLPRIQPMQDMYWQPKLKTQQASDVFADGRAMRPRVAGTVARGRLDEDDHYFRGFSVKPVEGGVKASFFDGFPAQVTVDDKLIHRGQARFNIYCSACHGLDGSGNGPVNARARNWPTPAWPRGPRRRTSGSSRR